MIQAIGYIRRSTDRQEESLDQQRAKLEAYAKQRGWELTHVYSDDAITGSDMMRPGLRQLIEDAQRRDDVGVVLTWDRNRLARPKDPVDGLLLERELLSAGKQVIYAATGQQADKSFASGLISYVEHYQNGDYLRKLSRDTVRGIISRVERGLWPGGPIPFGYDRLILDGDTPKRIIRDLEDGSQAILDPDTFEVVEQLPKGRRHKKQDHETCTLIPSDPARVRAVQKLFADYSAGKPMRIVRDAINASGFRTSRGSMFSAATLFPLLENPAYLGRCVYNRRTLSKWHRLKNGQSVERQDEDVEKRPEDDWIVAENAWPALVDEDTWASVQQRRKDSRNTHQKTSGSCIRSNYLLTGLMFCGVCGGKLTGQTIKSGKGYRTRYYVCCTHHNGQHERCPKRYTVPAKVVEDHITTTILRDLAALRDDDKLHEYIQQEVRRVHGSGRDAFEQLQRRLAELDQKLAKVRDHLTSLDTETAETLGLYSEAQLLAEKHREVEAELAKHEDVGKLLPDADELRRRAAAVFDRLESALSGGEVEEKRELIGYFVQKIKADPDQGKVQISLYPALFSRVVAGVGFEPTTSGL